ncbi:hypothetical protein BLA29_001328 [Euroglyphus maynei]|uniref:Uncharacterized protein n=1 Tax=Euroglyphus maynei TaxID=6958 RepID=A0A1Y3BNG2_EURMA|nr:hypothetical protein BLA29_001328 [Euroglyphus maynei]
MLFCLGASVPKEDEYHFLSEENDDETDDDDDIDGINHRLIVGHHNHHLKGCNINLDYDTANAEQLIDLAAVAAAVVSVDSKSPINLGRKLSQLRNSNASSSHSSAVAKGTENLQREALRKSNESGQYNLENSQRYIRLPPSPHSKKFSPTIPNVSPIEEKSFHKFNCNNSSISKSSLPTKQSPSNIIDSLLMCDALASPIQSISTPVKNHHSNSQSSHSASNQKNLSRSCTSSPSSLSSSRISPTPPPPPLPPHHHHHHHLTNSSTPTLVPRSANNNPPPRPKADKPNKHQQLSNMSSSTSATINMSRPSLTNNTTSLVSSIPSNVSGSNVHLSQHATNGVQIEPSSCKCAPPSSTSSSTTATTIQPSLNQCATCSTSSTEGNPVTAAGSSNSSNNQQTINNNLNSHHHHQQHQQFINKPPRGWLHPDHKLTDTDGPGVTYTVRVSSTCSITLYISFII